MNLLIDAPGRGAPDQVWINFLMEMRREKGDPDADYYAKRAEKILDERGVPYPKE